MALYTPLANLLGLSPKEDVKPPSNPAPEGKDPGTLSHVAEKYQREEAQKRAEMEAAALRTHARLGPYQPPTKTLAQLREEAKKEGSLAGQVVSEGRAGIMGAAIREAQDTRMPQTRELSSDETEQIQTRLRAVTQETQQPVSKEGFKSVPPFVQEGPEAAMPAITRSPETPQPSVPPEGQVVSPPTIEGPQASVLAESPISPSSTPEGGSTPARAPEQRKLTMTEKRAASLNVEGLKQSLRAPTSSWGPRSTPSQSKPPSEAPSGESKG